MMTSSPIHHPVFRAFSASHPCPVILDVAGLSLTETDKKRLLNPWVGGVILFGRNWQDRAQLQRLTSEIKTVRSDLIISVDHEGGRVQRFRTDGFTHLPPMSRLGILWKTQPSQAQNTAIACGYVLGSELRACGVDLSFTPVLDLAYGRSQVIGDRAFSRDVRVVSVLAQALIHGLLQSGMWHCAKHFPGHGFAQADSHTTLPIDRRALKTLQLQDMVPYTSLANALTAVMPAHVIYPQVDTKPAGFSPRWLLDILREELGFTGCVISDDLSMVAATTWQNQPTSYTDAAIAALDAGCDQVLLCNQSVVDQGRPIDQLLSGLSQAHTQKRWAWPPQRNAPRSLVPLGPAMPWDLLQTDPAYQQALKTIRSLPFI
jgi:beta-N-acetylhexosaminidase